MRRRAFLDLIASAAAAVWSITARAQQPERMPRIGVLMTLTEDDAEGQARMMGFLQALQQLGWTAGRDVRIDYRWGAGNVVLTRKYAAELVALEPDVLLCGGSLGLAALKQATRTMPIVFGSVVDPVGAGFVESLARPGGNITGFTVFEYSLSAKWPELLREIAPHVTRAAVLRDPTTAAGAGQLGAIQGAASSLALELRPIDVNDAGEIERAIVTFAGAPNGGVIVTGSTSATSHRDLIVTLAARHRLPTVYPARFFAVGGGLISYGPDRVGQFRRAAAYVDRILKGEKPADLPVQAPDKYELVINLKTAKALGLTVPPSLLARADEAIE